jgi:hypothetical protein
VKMFGETTSGDANELSGVSFSTESSSSAGLRGYALKNSSPPSSRAEASSL